MSRVPRLYCTSRLAAGQRIKLDDRLNHYCRKVLRLPDGAPVCLFDGSGGEYAAELEGSGKTLFARVGAHDPVQREPAIEIHLALGLSSGDRFDQAVRDSTQCGAASITPLLCERTQGRRDAARTAKKMRHWQEIAISAAEQSGGTRVTQLQPPTAPADLAPTGALWICTPADSTLPGPADISSSLTLAIGPEGGFTDTEIATLAAAGGRPVSLGNRVLRTETAPVYTMALIETLARSTGPSEDS